MTQDSPVAFFARQLADLAAVGKMEVIAAGAVGVAIAVAAFGPHLDLVLKRLEFQVTHPGLERAPALKRLSVLTSSILMAGSLHAWATVYAFLSDMKTEADRSWTVMLLFGGFGLYSLAFLVYLVRVNIFDQAVRLLARLTLTRSTSR